MEDREIRYLKFLAILVFCKTVSIPRNSFFEVLLNFFFVKWSILLKKSCKGAFQVTHIYSIDSKYYLDQSLVDTQKNKIINVAKLTIGTLFQILFTINLHTSVEFPIMPQMKRQHQSWKTSAVHTYWKKDMFVV